MVWQQRGSAACREQLVSTEDVAVAMVASMAAAEKEDGAIDQGHGCVWINNGLATDGT